MLAFSPHSPKEPVCPETLGGSQAQGDGPWAYMQSIIVLGSVYCEQFWGLELTTLSNQRSWLLLSGFFLDLFILLFYVHEYFVCVYVCVPHGCLMLVEIRRGHQIAWDWSYRWL